MHRPSAPRCRWIEFSYEMCSNTSPSEYAKTGATPADGSNKKIKKRGVLHCSDRSVSIAKAGCARKHVCAHITYGSVSGCSGRAWSRRHDKQVCDWLKCAVFAHCGLSGGERAAMKWPRFTYASCRADRMKKCIKYVLIINKCRSYKNNNLVFCLSLLLFFLIRGLEKSYANIVHAFSDPMNILDLRHRISASLHPWCRNSHIESHRTVIFATRS